MEGFDNIGVENIGIENIHLFKSKKKSDEYLNNIIEPIRKIQEIRRKLSSILNEPNEHDDIGREKIRQYVRSYILIIIDLSNIDRYDDIMNLGTPILLKNVDKMILDILPIYLNLNVLSLDQKDIEMEIELYINQQRQINFPKFEDGIDFYQTLLEDIQPLEVYVNLVRLMGVESTIQKSIKMYQEIINGLKSSLTYLNKPNNRYIFDLIHGI